jgi:exopolysaccharide production protein ExoQ
MSQLIPLGCFLVAIWLIRRDSAQRTGISPALWIPTLWAGILLSKPISSWMGSGYPGGGAASMDGSSVDALFYFVLIVAAFIVLSKRQLNWSEVLSENWAVFLFYGYLLVTVSWAEFPEISFKRWFKEFGNILVLLVILTEINPQQAVRAVFVRCAYLWIPLSIVFIRYFPDVGRRYSRSGQLEAIGVTLQKNSLGVMVVICLLVLIWDWIERSRPGAQHQKWLDRYLPVAFLAMGIYLLRICDSKTAMIGLALGGCVLASVKLPFFRQRIGAFGGYVLALAVGAFLVEWFFGIKEQIIEGMGRDMTFTGRTDVWRELLNVKTDPIIGTGFCSFWSNNDYLSKLPEWVAFSAHNGFLETYIDGGLIAVFFLILMLIAVGLKINGQLSMGGNYALFRFAVFLVAIVANFSESHFGRMSSLGFFFLLAAIDPPWAERAVAPDRHVSDEDTLSSSPVRIAPGDMAV